jgi:NAD(P)-dependent dehydrogenase (short-subunit alcohol dehydrogenase family)
MSRTYVVTGSASGIGQATTNLLVKLGHTVIGVDRSHANIVADLSTADGRNELVDAVAKLTDTVDGLICAAGLALDAPVTAQVNYYGTLATLIGLRPFLANSAAPRAVVLASVAVLFDADADLLGAFEEYDEAAAIVRAEAITDQPGAIYSTSKRAVARWVKRHAPTSEWAGAGIALNAIAPGMVMTPMISEQIKLPEVRRAMLERVPMPLNGIAEADDIARALAWFAGPENTHITGQIIYIDGGAEASLRGVGTL